MTGAAMQKCLDVIGETSRPERKQRNETILQGHRVMELVERKRYSFEEACRLLDIDEPRIAKALFWIKTDNERIEKEHGYGGLKLNAWDWEMLGFFRQMQPMGEFGAALFGAMARVHADGRKQS